MYLSHNLEYDELYSFAGINKIDNYFFNYLKKCSQDDLCQQLINVRQNCHNFTLQEQSALIINLSPYLNQFIAELFNVTDLIDSFSQRNIEALTIAEAKKLFVKRFALVKFKDIAIPDDTIVNIAKEIIGDTFTEIKLAQKMIDLLSDKTSMQADIIAKYVIWAIKSSEGRKYHKDWILFNLPRKNNQELFTDKLIEDSDIAYKNKYIRFRDGFNLTDEGHSYKYTIDQTKYCINCHKQAKDSCSRGLKDKDGVIKYSTSNIALNGCPLEEKISEMNIVKGQGFDIAALAVAVIDNPMIAATGRRICNDCMKACIYQKQEPVNIPEIETKTLSDVLDLPYGFEIYSLLTRWNPLNFMNYMLKKDSNNKVLVVGMGPSGFTLAHYLLNSGHLVVGIDGLKIEPLPQDIIDKPIKNIRDLYENLSERVVDGFGGVTEYGITSRWNKNFLKIIRLLLAKRNNFTLIGGVRFGGTINHKQAFDIGFDHIALCIGAGKPNILNVDNALARGVRMASDFLMNLQLSGAAKRNSISNLQIRLPIVVIGGGLTAIDAATEALAYYPIQIEKFLCRVEKIGGIDKLQLDAEEIIIANEFITHAKILRQERQQRCPQPIKYLRKWGGVKVLYRKNLNEAPCYKLNHEEVEKALEEGIKFVENITPLRIKVDCYQHVEGIYTKHSIIDSQEIYFPAKTILVATGTSPNNVLAQEYPDIYQVNGKYFRQYSNHNSSCLTYVDKHHRGISFFGDMHPNFSGNVVKAMASAKYGYPQINQMLALIKPTIIENFNDKITEELSARIVNIERLTNNIIEITLKAPFAARNFQPGQFYRLQNFEKNIQNSSNIVLEPLAMTGAKVDKDRGLISTIILEMGGSSSLCHNLQINEKVILMGPTGTATTITKNENILLIGGGLGNAVLFSIGQSFRNQGSKVTYFAGYKNVSDRCRVEEIEKSADNIIWCCDEQQLLTTRQQDISFHGNIIEAIKYHAQTTIDLSQIDRIICIGSDGMMAAVQNLLLGSLVSMLKNNVKIICSVNSPMQCMMKEICAQCLQKHFDPQTQKTSYVFSCSNQDQNMKKVDFTHLKQRLRQNSLHEKLIATLLKFTQNDIQNA